jgi:hypothetical protein
MIPMTATIYVKKASGRFLHLWIPLILLWILLLPLLILIAPLFLIACLLFGLNPLRIVYQFWKTLSGLSGTNAEIHHERAHLVFRIS